MSVTRGKRHDFIGMKVEFLQDGRLSISMRDYLEECIAVSGESFNRGATTPARTGLFVIDENAIELDEDKKDIFHHIVAKLLFVAKRGRLDIDLAISFLCSRVDRSMSEDWMKLKQLLHYINGTLGLKRHISIDDYKVLRTWVDMLGNTGGVISLGGGIIHHKSSKQRLNTKSSTETELIGASDYIPHNVWMKRFLQEQGYEL